jgi:ABC-type multidrug transport system fused ATPase/permease subunit
MKKLLIYLRGYKKECVLAPLFKMLEASFELVVPLVIAAMIDKGIKRGDGNFVLKMCGILIMLGVIGLLCSVTAQYFSAKAAVGFGTQVRHALFEHLLGLSFTEIDTLGTSTMITRMTSDVNQAQHGVNMTLRLFLRSPFVVFGAMVMAFTIDKKCAWLFVWVILALSVVVFGVMLLNIPMLKKVQQRLDDVLGITRENLLGVRVIRAFCKEEEEIKQFKEKNNSLTLQLKKAGRLSAVMNPLTYVLINLGIVLLIWQGAWQVEGGILTQGEVVALYNYMSQILVELIKLASFIIILNKAITCGNRIEDVLETESSMVFETTPYAELIEGKISFENVSLQYAGEKEASLSGISFELQPGKTLGVIGGTGSGKTSLVHLIPRFYDATAGVVKLDDKDVKAYSEVDLREKIGVVLQKAVLFKGTIADNIRWGYKEATDEEILEALKVAQAEDVLDKKGGLLGEVEQGGRNLSGGQKQRLSIARAIVKNPKILILDDSASALDFATDARLRQAIANLKEKMSVVIVSQRASAIQHADLIVVLEDGRMVGRGSHQHLLESCEVYQEIYYSQFKKKEGLK